MKKIVLILVFTMSGLSYGQNIVFADANFKNVLLNRQIDFDSPYTGVNYPPIDANNDGEISQAEALLIRKLDTYYSRVSDFGGIEFFTNLKYLNALYFDGSTFNYPTLVNLEEISITNALNGISPTNVDFSGNINLKSISIFMFGNIVPNLNNLVNLQFLNIGGGFTSLDLSDCVKLNTLYLRAPITQLDLSNCIKLVTLSLSCNLQTLDISNNLNLETVDASNNGIVSINLGSLQYIRSLGLQNNLLQTLNTNNLFNLETLDLTNNNLQTLFIENNNLIFVYGSSLGLAGNPYLQSVCCDANEIVYVQNICNINNYTATVSSCNLSQKTASAITMYPNPVKDMLHLNSSEKISKIEVFGSNGLLIMTNENVVKTVDMQSLQNGLYFLKIYRENEITEMKFLKG
jgi:Secretion system C-terminal sorting domain